jgi:hypothetical protein
MLYPAWGRPGLTGGRLRTPLRTHCHLALYPELGSTERSVLVVTITLQFQFRNGKDERGNRLTWSESEKVDFAWDAKLAIKSQWDDRYRIRTTSTVPPAPFRDVGVMFMLLHLIDGRYVHDDYELKVTKISPGASGRTFRRRWFPGSYVMNSEDVVPQPHLPNLDYPPPPTPLMQRGIVHEFGHMLGLRDEYPGALKANQSWFADQKSVMHSDEMVRPRHYVPFASWLADQFAQESRSRRVRTTYQVDGGTEGPWDESNASL